MSEKNNYFQSFKSSIQGDSSTLDSKFQKRIVEINEPYSMNMTSSAANNLMNQIGGAGQQHHHHSAYHSFMSQGNSFQNRFTAKFPSSSDLYGAAIRGGMVKDGSGRYFGKSKFSVNSQQATKTMNSVLSSISEGP